MNFRALPSILLFSVPLSAQTTISSFDLVDDFFKVGSNYTGPGSYDIFDGSTGMTGMDGKVDVVVSISSSGEGADGNGVTWATSNDTTPTGIRSTIDPSGSVVFNNGGHKACQIITLSFGPGLTIEAQDILDFGWSSGNTAGIIWETSSIEYEVNGGGYVITSADHGSYAAPGTGGVVGNGFLATGTGTQTGVGTNLVAVGSSGPSNNLSTDPVGDMGIVGTDIITGVRFIHCVEDVRGINNGDTIFTATINDFDIQNVTVAPEPSTALLSAFALLGLLRRRR